MHLYFADLPNWVGGIAAVGTLHGTPLMRTQMPGAHGEGCGCKLEDELGVGEFLFGYIDRDGVRGVNEQVRYPGF